MKIFHVQNLTQQAMRCDILPWDFKPTETLTTQIRKSKEDRGHWYQNPKTTHYFYTGIEPVNPNQRPSKENPPQAIHALCVDYDVAIPAERVLEVVAAMEIKPAWFERSLGGNVRLIFTFEEPILTGGNYDFAVYLAQASIKWMSLNLLPGLDENHLTRLSVLLCNGCAWEPTGHGPVPAKKVQAFVVAAARKFNFRSSSEVKMPLDQVEKEIRARFPNFSWPTDFALESQGPSFWIPESLSPQSAIIKRDGMFTFSAHADRPFYTWADIIGKEVLKEFSETAIDKATRGVYFDGKQFWRKNLESNWINLDMAEMSNFLTVDCGLSSKVDKDTPVPMTAKALSHIYNHNRIEGAASFVFQPSGLMEYQGKRCINTYTKKPVQPSVEAGVWGPSGNFPTLCRWLEALFMESDSLRPKEQLYRFLAWWKWYYESAIHYKPMPGTALFLVGPVRVGKTYLNREIVGRSVGGFVDAAKHLIKREPFTDYMFETPHWALDDETISANSDRQLWLQQAIKQAAANHDQIFNKKFQKSSMCSWMGRIFATTNLDSVSMRILGPMDASVLNKVTLFRCSDEEYFHSQFTFPSRATWPGISNAELPYLLNWLLNWEVPDWIKRDTSWGFEPWHEPSLLDKAHENSHVGPVKELLFEMLTHHFKEYPEVTEWRGCITQIMRAMESNPLNGSILRVIRLEQLNRHLELIQREGVLDCKTETGIMKTRLWIFPKTKELSGPTTPLADTAPPTNDKSKFQK